MSSRVDLKLSEVLEGGVVLPAFSASGLEDALGALLAPPLAAAGLDGGRVASVLDAVRLRERAGSTAIGPVALPHARVPGLQRIVAGLGANASGVYAGDGGTTFVLAFASPAQSAAEHLRFLARAAQLFRDEGARGRLLQAGTRDEMLAIVRGAER